MFSTLFQRKKGSAFHGTLKRVVQSGGIYKQKKGKQININMMLASYLMDSIDEDFRKTFPYGYTLYTTPFNK